jgi:hypothetical protein
LDGNPTKQQQQTRHPARDPAPTPSLRLCNGRSCDLHVSSYIRMLKKSASLSGSSSLFGLSGLSGFLVERN